MTAAPKALRELYERRYKGDMKFGTSMKGLHSVLLTELGDELDERRVLDVGCGSGRLALFCGSGGAHVTAIDFSETAIDLARSLQAGLEEPPANVRFEVGRFEAIEERFDLIFMTEVIEHLEAEPASTLATLRRLVATNSRLVISCPAFLNLRGSAWMTLQLLFDFLMSPSDVHFVAPWQMYEWCEETGWTIERHLGLYHDWAWGAWGAEDMKRRIGLALRDKRRDDPRWRDIQVDLESMNRYLDAQARLFEGFIEDHGPSSMKSSRFEPTLRLRAELLETEFGTEAQDYLNDANIRYADTSPLNHLGASGVYICRAV